MTTQLITIENLTATQAFKKGYMTKVESVEHGTWLKGSPIDQEVKTFVYVNKIFAAIAKKGLNKKDLENIFGVKDTIELFF